MLPKSFFWRHPRHAPRHSSHCPYNFRISLILCTFYIAADNSGSAARPIGATQASLPPRRFAKGSSAGYPPIAVAIARCGGPPKGRGQVVGVL